MLLAALTDDLVNPELELLDIEEALEPGGEEREQVGTVRGR